jgi:hypothetical protein
VFELAGDIATLAFTQARIPLINQSRHTNPNDAKHADDRTTQVIRKWSTATNALRAARLQTMQTLEARPGKGDQITLAVVDRKQFDALQVAIAGHEEQISALEVAIAKLDALGADLWYDEYRGRIGRLRGTEETHARRLTADAAAALMRANGSGKKPEQILAEDHNYQGRLKATQEDTARAKAALAKEEPKLAELKAILEAVGC